MACTETLYIENATNLQEKITRYDQIITALEDALINSDGNYDKVSYSLDDGQVKIQSQYRSAMEIANAIEKFMKLRQYALNKLNGRVIVLRPWRGLQ